MIILKFDIITGVLRISDSRVDDGYIYTKHRTAGCHAFTITVSALSSGELLLISYYNEHAGAFSLIPTSDGGKTLPEWNIYREWRDYSESITIEGPDDLEWSVVRNK